MSSSDDSTQINASVVWEQLSQQLDALVTAWQRASEPPRLSDFVPGQPPELRRLTLVEAVKIDLEYRWQNRRWPKLVEDYLSDFPELAAEGGVSCDVIYEEYHIRKQQGDTVSIDEYCERFPTRIDELRRLFQIDAPTQSTVMVATERLPEFEVGQQVDDFDLLGPLGKGAFASVFRARQRSMQRIVALKISRDRSLEPQMLAQLEHPHIVRVFDQRQLADCRLRLLYMQYVPGGTLQGVVEQARRSPAGRNGATLLAAVDAALARNGEEPPSDSMTRYRLRAASWPQIVCWVGARLASALSHAHGHGVLHRDLKPANVLVGADAQPRLADFNISFSKLDGATPAAYFGGTLAYMSPEQLEAYDPAHERTPDTLDARSDVYSLGVMLWELLTLRRPFADLALADNWSKTLPRMTAARLAGVPPDVQRQARADFPPMVVDVLAKCLAPRPEDRYASAAELARALDLCLQPRAHELLHGGTSWTGRLKRHPVAATLTLGLLPNVFMCIVNIIYNWIEIVDKLSPQDQRVFYTQIVGVNVIGYTVGLGYICLPRMGLFKTLNQLVRGQSVAPPPPIEMVRRSLMMGTATAIVTAVLWTISGFAIPTWMHYGAGPTSQLSSAHYLHFVVSNLLCGMISSTQSFYVVSYLSVRFCYPWLFQARPPDARDLPELSRLSRIARVFFGFTLSVPFLALGALLMIDVGRAVIGALAAIGFLGCVLAYVLDLAIRADLSALAAAMNSSGDALAAGDSFDSTLAGSRR